MIKYPLNVTIDSNIFDAAKYDFSPKSTLSLLVSYVEQGKIKVYLSDIVQREVLSHVKEKADEVAHKAKRLRKDLLKLSSGDFINAVGLGYSIQNPDIEGAVQKSVENLEQFWKKLSPEILSYEGISIEQVLDDYFLIRPPFEPNTEKRKEFPDAFFAAQIKKRFHKDIIAIVSDDDGFKAGCGIAPNMHFYSSLKELFDAINKDEAEYSAVIALITKLSKSIGIEVRRELLDQECFEVNGLSYDKDGIVSGYDYEDCIIHKLSAINCRIHTVDKLDEESIITTLVCEGYIEVDCEYLDYDNAHWDQETESYWYLEKRTIRELHNARFGVQVEISRQDESFTLSGFKAILGSGTRNGRYDIQEAEELEAEIEAQDREDLGFIPFEKYADKLEDILPDSSLSTDIVEVFEQFNTQYSLAEEYSSAYCELDSLIDDDEREEQIESFLIDFVKKFASKDGFPEINLGDKLSSDDYSAIVGWIRKQYDILSNLGEYSLPDCIQYGDSISIKGINEEYCYEMEEISINPSEGDEEEIYITLSDSDGNILAKGFTKLLVGYLHFDEDGGASDGLDDEISYEYGDIINRLNELVDCLSSYISEQKEISDYITKYFGL